MMPGFSHILHGALSTICCDIVQTGANRKKKKKTWKLFLQKRKGTQLAMHSLPAIVRWLSLQTKKTHRQPEQPEHSGHSTHEVAPGHAQPKLTNHFASFLVFAKKKSLLV